MSRRADAIQTRKGAIRVRDIADPSVAGAHQFQLGLGAARNRGQVIRSDTLERYGRVSRHDLSTSQAPPRVTVWNPTTENQLVEQPAIGATQVPQYAKLTKLAVQRLSHPLEHNVGSNGLRKEGIPDSGLLMVHYRVVRIPRHEEHLQPGT